MAKASVTGAVASTHPLFSNRKIPFNFNSENEPNADVLLPGLRKSGYTLQTAVGDLADNPLDADADVIAISLDKTESDWLLSVADNGSGMSLDVLDQMMRLGSRSEHDLNSDLGAFGLGSTTASLSLGRMQHVLTRMAGEPLLSAATDLDETIRQRKFVKHISEATPDEKEMFAFGFVRWGLEVPNSGTLVTVSKIDNLGRSRLEPALEALRKYIGQTYRYFIWANRKFYVNGELVAVIDPLERNLEESRVLIDDAFEYTFPEKHPRAGEKESIGAILVELPDWGGMEANRARGYNQQGQGFYVMRNRREIVAGTTFGMWARHNKLNRFRGELLFPATIDEDLGVSFLKSAWDIKPSQSLEDKLRQLAMPYVRQVEKRYRTSTKNADEQVPHDEAAKVIRQRAPFLRTPKSVKERREPRSESGSKERSKKEGNGSRKPKDPRTQSALADKAEFRVVDGDVYAPFYEPDLEGQKIIITYNGRHPFYERFILENRDNRSVIAGIDYLVYSLAAAELLAYDESTYEFIGKMREDTSFNLRQLLST